MVAGWTDLQTAAQERRLLIARGQPTFEHADIFLWDEADLMGWLDAAVHVGVRIAYADEETFNDRVDQLRLTLEDLRGDFDEQFETEADDLERTLNDLAGRHGREVLGWSGEWRHAGIAHAIMLIRTPSSLQPIADLLEKRSQSRPSRSEIRKMDSVDWEQRRAAEEELRQARWEAAVQSLVGNSEFRDCKNQSSRKNLLNKLRVDTTGLNKEDLIAEARNRLADRPL